MGLKRFIKAWRRRSLWHIIGVRLRAWRHSLKKDNPWPTELDQQVRAEDAVPVCHRCFTPLEHADQQWFCPECGAASGPYNNLMPFVYIFSIGEVLRSGTARHARYSPLRLAGYMAMCLAQFVLFFPVYMGRVCWNLWKGTHVRSAEAVEGGRRRLWFWVTLLASVLLLSGFLAGMRSLMTAPRFDEFYPWDDEISEGYLPHVPAVEWQKMTNNPFVQPVHVVPNVGAEPVRFYRVVPHP